MRGLQGAEELKFIHAADLHLGYAQYNLEARRQDFLKAFEELVERAIELNPDFVLMAGDLFHQARPSNVTLEEAVRNFRRLKEAGIPVLAVDGSHDSAPNVLTGTILNPLDSAGLIHYLPRHEGACWQDENYYVYGLPNFRTRRRAEEELPAFLMRNPPKPDASRFNILAFHMAIDSLGFVPPYVEAEATPEMIPNGFDYYASGHVHTPMEAPFKTGILVYSGCIETVNYEDARVEKGFYYVEVDERKVMRLQYVKLKSPRKFVVLEGDFIDAPPSEVADAAAKLVEKVDEEGIVIVPIIRGKLPLGFSRSEIDIVKIREAARSALIVRPVLQLTERELPERPIEAGLKDLRERAFRYFIEVLKDRYPKERAERIARLAMEILDPLVHKDEDVVKRALEEFVREDRARRA